jgi:hypothetical protein
MSNNNLDKVDDDAIKSSIVKVYVDFLAEENIKDGPNSRRANQTM